MDFLSIPFIPLFNILWRLDEEELTSLYFVNKFFSNIIIDEYTWKEYVHKHIIDNIDIGSNLIANEHRVTLKSDNGAWNSAKTIYSYSTGIHYWETKIIKFNLNESNTWKMVIGAITDNIELCNEHRVKSYGFICGNGKKIRDDLQESLRYSNKNINDGDIIGILLDLNKYNLYVYINGKCQQLCHANLSDKNSYYPCISIYTKNSSIEFITSPLNIVRAIYHYIHRHATS